MPTAVSINRGDTSVNIAQYSPNSVTIYTAPSSGNAYRIVINGFRWDILSGGSPASTQLATMLVLRDTSSRDFPIGQWLPNTNYTSAAVLPGASASPVSGPNNLGQGNTGTPNVGMPLFMYFGGTGGMNVSSLYGSWYSGSDLYQYRAATQQTQGSYWPASWYMGPGDSIVFRTNSAGYSSGYNCQVYWNFTVIQES